MSPYLTVRPTDLTSLKRLNGGIYSLRNIVAAIDGSRAVRAHGDATMPVWGEVFKREAEGKKYPTLTSLLKIRVIAEHIAALQR